MFFSSFAQNFKQGNIVWSASLHFPDDIVKSVISKCFNHWHNNGLLIAYVYLNFMDLRVSCIVSFVQKRATITNTRHLSCWFVDDGIVVYRAGIPTPIEMPTSNDHIRIIIKWEVRKIAKKCRRKKKIFIADKIIWCVSSHFNSAFYFSSVKLEINGCSVSMLKWKMATNRHWINRNFVAKECTWACASACVCRWNWFCQGKSHSFTSSSYLPFAAMCNYVQLPFRLGFRLSFRFISLLRHSFLVFSYFLACHFIQRSKTNSYFLFFSLFTSGIVVTIFMIHFVSDKVNQRMRWSVAQN